MPLGCGYFGGDLMRDVDRGAGLGVGRFSLHAWTSMTTLLATISARWQAAKTTSKTNRQAAVLVALRVPLVLETGPTVHA